jgi:hypothetical protein
MAVLACSAVSTVVDPAVFQDLVQYREFRDSGQLPAGNPFSYVKFETDQVVRSGWASGALWTWFMISTGWEAVGLSILKYLLCFGIAIGCHGYVVRQSVSLPVYSTLAVIALLIAAPLGFGEINATKFSAVCLLAMLQLIAADNRRGGFWIWGVVPLMVVWCNLHEGVFLGWMILAVYCLSKFAELYRERHGFRLKLDGLLYLPVLFVAATLSTMLNPDGWRLMAHFFMDGNNGQFATIGSQPIWLSQSVPVQVLFLLSVGLSLYSIHRVRPWPIFESIVLLITGLFAINRPEYGIAYLITWFCLTSPLIERAKLGEQLRIRYSLFSGQVAAASFAMGIMFIGLANQSRFWETRLPDEPSAAFKQSPVYPIAATSFLLEKKFQGKLLVTYDIGSYVIWRLYPHVKVSADTRLAWAYSPQASNANRDFYLASESWRNQSASSTDAILIPISAPILPAITQAIKKERLPWREVYRDRGHAIFVRSGTQVAELLADNHSHPK